jgi:hypothetical protein
MDPGDNVMLTYLKLFDSLHDFSGARGNATSVDKILRGFTNDAKEKEEFQGFLDYFKLKTNLEETVIEKIGDIIPSVVKGSPLTDGMKRLVQNLLIPSKISASSVNTHSTKSPASVDGDPSHYVFEFVFNKTTNKPEILTPNGLKVLSLIKRLFKKNYDRSADILFDAANHYTELLSSLLRNADPVLDGYAPMRLIYSDASMWDSGTNKANPFRSHPEYNIAVHPVDFQTGDILELVKNNRPCTGDARKEILHLKGLHGDNNAIVQYLTKDERIIHTGPSVRELSRDDASTSITTQTTTSADKALFPPQSGPERTLCNSLLIKRSGDWGQVAFCLKYKSILYTYDRLCALFALYRNCPFIFTMTVGDKFYMVFFGGSLSKNDLICNEQRLIDTYRAESDEIKSTLKKVITLSTGQYDSAIRVLEEWKLDTDATLDRGHVCNSPSINQSGGVGEVWGVGGSVGKSKGVRRSAEPSTKPIVERCGFASKIDSPRATPLTSAVPSKTDFEGRYIDAWIDDVDGAGVYKQSVEYIQTILDSSQLNEYYKTMIALHIMVAYPIDDSVGKERKYQALTSIVDIIKSTDAAGIPTKLKENYTQHIRSLMEMTDKKINDYIRTDGSFGTQIQKYLSCIIHQKIQAKRKPFSSIIKSQEVPPSLEIQHTINDRSCGKEIVKIKALDAATDKAHIRCHIIPLNDFIYIKPKNELVYISKNTHIKRCMDSENNFAKNPKKGSKKGSNASLSEQCSALFATGLRRSSATFLDNERVHKSNLYDGQVIYTHFGVVCEHECSYCIELYGSFLKLVPIAQLKIIQSQVRQFIDDTGQKGSDFIFPDDVLGYFLNNERYAQYLAMYHSYYKLDCKLETGNESGRFVNLLADDAFFKTTIDQYMFTGIGCSGNEQYSNGVTQKKFEKIGLLLIATKKTLRIQINPKKGKVTHTIDYSKVDLLSKLLIKDNEPVRTSGMKNNHINKLSYFLLDKLIYLYTSQIDGEIDPDYGRLLMQYFFLTDRTVKLESVTHEEFYNRLIRYTTVKLPIDEVDKSGNIAWGEILVHKYLLTTLVDTTLIDTTLIDRTPEVDSVVRFVDYLNKLSNYGTKASTATNAVDPSKYKATLGMLTTQMSNLNEAVMTSNQELSNGSLFDHLPKIVALIHFYVMIHDLCVKSGDDKYDCRRTLIKKVNKKLKKLEYTDQQARDAMRGGGGGMRSPICSSPRLMQGRRTLHQRETSCVTPVRRQAMDTIRSGGGRMRSPVRTYQHQVKGRRTLRLATSGATSERRQERACVAFSRFHQSHLHNGDVVVEHQDNRFDWVRK